MGWSKTVARMNIHDICTTDDLWSYQPLRWVRPKYSERLSLGHVATDSETFLDETNSLSLSSTRVEEAPSKQHQCAPKRNCLKTLISAQEKTTRAPAGRRSASPTSAAASSALEKGSARAASTYFGSRSSRWAI